MEFILFTIIFLCVIVSIAFIRLEQITRIRVNAFKAGTIQELPDFWSMFWKFADL